MPYTARSIENGGTITDAFASSEIVANEGVGQANLPKSGSVAEIRRIPRLPTNVDGGEANGQRVFRLELPLDIDAASCRSPHPPWLYPTPRRCRLASYRS